MKRKAETQRHALDTTNDRTDIEAWADRENGRLILAINDRLTCKESSEFLADRKEATCRFDLLAICREWMHRVGLDSAPNPRESKALTYFDRAKEIVEGDNLWFPGKAITVDYSENIDLAITVDYSNVVGDLYLVATTPNGKVQTRCARLPIFVDGATYEETNGKYVWVLTADEYRQWRQDIQDAISKSRDQALPAEPKTRGRNKLFLDT